MIESEYISKSDTFIAGTDEVGRGPLAGPVVGGCVLIQGNLNNLNDLSKFLREMGVTDSKKLTDLKRKKILDKLSISFEKGMYCKIRLCKLNVHISVVEKSPRDIEKFNILQASLISMKNALDTCLKNVNRKIIKGSILIDGNKVFEAPLGQKCFPVIKGDSKSVVIGLASIAAKVYRDDLMTKLSKKYPNYGFEKNAGYPTQFHRDAIESHGITPVHRKSFRGVKEFVTN